MLEIRRYTPAMANEWNKFVAASKNGTFLFDRNFMDYHSDRFHDHSLLVYRGHQLYALLPTVGVRLQCCHLVDGLLDQCRAVACLPVNGHDCFYIRDGLF